MSMFNDRISFSTSMHNTAPEAVQQLLHTLYCTKTLKLHVVENIIGLIIEIKYSMFHN